MPRGTRAGRRYDPGVPARRTGRTRQRVSVELRRAEILAATRAVVLAKGFAGTRVQDVAAHLGVSTGLIHYHFSSKDDLLAETLRFAADAEIQRLEKAVATADHALARIDRVVQAYVPGRRDLSWQLWIDAWGAALRNPRLREISLELDQAWVALLERIITEGVAEGRFRCADPRAAAWRLSALMDGLSLQVVLHPRLLGKAEMLRLTREAIAAELGFDPAVFERPGRARAR